MKVLPFRAGKSLLEALIFASTNPQYDSRLFIELVLVKYMKIPSSEHVLYTNCFALIFRKSYVLSLEFSCTELIIQ